MNPLCVAIDTADGSVVDALAEATEPYAGMFKVGATTFAGLGPPVVTRLAASRPVFCDLKLCDIPSQVGGAIAALSALGVTLATVHALGGREMVRTAAKEASGELKILAVTILTSLDSGDLTELGVRGTASEAVVRLADMALEAGASGLVCSGQEAAALRQRFGPAASGGPLLVVPGIRFEGGPSADQQRTLGPRAALDAGADILVVGRPITAAPDPGAAARRISMELAR
ncbi:MAG: orotidine-5-phosphate decarboxylase [Actinomycetota bacterium]|nr:orotidine-5-phosphate decarboxylase [Actinomycetota bacterium]